ncbi:acidic amino acid decarboxylase GADL1 [Gavia stellata]|nr:acidic amino acid decarboxylase GADL1 [Gavia stellata]
MFLHVAKISEEMEEIGEALFVKYVLVKLLPLADQSNPFNEARCDPLFTETYLFGINWSKEVSHNSLGGLKIGLSGRRRQAALPRAAARRQACAGPAGSQRPAGTARLRLLPPLTPGEGFKAPGQAFEAQKRAASQAATATNPQLREEGQLTGIKNAHLIYRSLPTAADPHTGGGRAATRSGRLPPPVRPAVPQSPAPPPEEAAGGGPAAPKVLIEGREAAAWRLRVCEAKAAGSAWLVIYLTVGICKQEMLQKKNNAVLVDGVILNGPITDSKAGEKFVEEACKIVMEEVIQKADDVTEKVCEWRAPETLKQILDLEMRDTGESHQKLLQLCRDVIQYSVKTSHPRFFNQLYAGIDYYSLVARFITEALNPSVYTYEVSPVFLLVEEAVIKKMIEFIGWEEGDGIFNPGGSVSNMYAMNLARYKFCPDIKEKGLSGLPRLVLFTSEECHYSMKKAASFLGIGTENVYFIKTDERGKMIPEELEKQVQRARKEGSAPFLVCATAGTTVLGAFDPLDKIADICEKHGLWLHVDASWGGSALVSRKHCRLLHGIHRADSVAWNPHKMLLAGIQCCALLVKDNSGLLKKCYSAKASYLFQQDKFYDVSYDTGDKSIQCSRRPDAFKFWLMWKALGTTGLEERVNRALALARYLVEEIKKREGFQLLLEPEYANVCFWYIPPSLRKMEDGPEFWQKLHQVAPVIKERMMKKGSMMLGYQPHQGKVNFFRQVVISPQVSREDMDFLLDEIELLAKDL